MSLGLLAVFVRPLLVIPAEAGIQLVAAFIHWIAAFAGMTAKRAASQ